MLFQFAVWLLGAPGSSILWSCKADNRLVFTNRPAVSDSAPCKPELLERAPFTRVPAEYFYQLSDPEVDVAGKPRARQSTQTRSLDPEPFSASWKMEELAPVVGGLASNCRLWGKARGGVPGPAVVSILRGGATIDKVRISLRKRGETPWEVLLLGKCRSPQVSVKSVSRK